MSARDTLRLIAFDAEDLGVISAHLQDADVLPSEVAFLPRERRFALLADRFDWFGDTRGTPRRFRTGIHFEGVSNVRSMRFDQGGTTPATLVAIRFVPGDCPAGRIVLDFDRGGAIMLEVDYIEAAMSDLDDGHACSDRPRPRT